MSISKRQGAVGIKLQTVAGTAASAPPTRIFLCESASITGDPVQVERLNSVSAECLGVTQYGLDVKGSVSGAECNCYDLGYLLAAFLGSDTYATAKHTIVPVFDSKFITMFKDQGALIATGKYTELGVGMRIDSLGIDQQSKQFAKVAFGGPCCKKDQLTTTRITPSLSLTANDAPLSWKALQAGAFKLGYNSLTRVADTNITGLKIDMKRNLTPGGISLAGDQPTDIVQGGRELTMEYTRDFAGDTAALAEYATYLAGTDFVSVEMKWLCGTYYVQITFPHCRITADPLPEIGSSEDVQALTIKLKAFQNASSNVCDVEVVDSTVAVYT